MMNEQYEQILSFAENELVDKEGIRCAALAAQPEKQKNPIAWMRIVLPIAACLVMVCGSALLIPSARAEVFSWFGASRPAEYLTADPDERPDIPALNALVASPDANAEVVSVPIDRTEPVSVDSEYAAQMTAFLNENRDVALGEAMYDGMYIHQMLHLNGLSGLYLLEPWTGSHTTALFVDSEWMEPDGWIIYEMPDGTRFYGTLDLTDTIAPYVRSLQEQGLTGKDAAEPIDASNRQYLLQSGLSAVAEVSPHDVEPYLDADGRLTAKVWYSVSITAETDSGVASAELYLAQIGTITIDMQAYRNIPERTLESTDGACVWNAETILIKGEPLSAEGLTMTAETKHAVISLFGIRSIQLRITLPQAWTHAQREAFAETLQFRVQINGEDGNWYPQYVYCQVQKDGSVLWIADEIMGVPYETLQSVQTITLIPMPDAAEYPQYAVTLHVR